MTRQTEEKSIVDMALEEWARRPRPEPELTREIADDLGELLGRYYPEFQKEAP